MHVLHSFIDLAIAVCIKLPFSTCVRTYYFWETNDKRKLSQVSSLGIVLREWPFDTLNPSEKILKKLGTNQRRKCFL